jgi:P-type conjugative transfer ATPase TrbB
VEIIDERSKRIREKLARELGEVVCGALSDPLTVEVMLNPDGQLWVERLGKPMERVGEMNASQAESLMSTVASTLRTVIDRSNPILECELPLDGSRFEALLPPVVSAPTFAIRKKASQVFSLDRYVRDGVMSADQCATISRAVEKRKNILIVGGTGSGKTTLANAIIDHIVACSPEHRLVIIEDTAEIQCSAKNAVILRATDTVDMLRLLKATMRLRPDRILVGEVRGPEALALLKAWNTGHPGGCATVHANNARAGLVRIEQLISEATPGSVEQLRPVIGEAVDLIVSIERDAQRGRRVKEVLAVERFDRGQYITHPEGRIE